MSLIETQINEVAFHKNMLSVIEYYNFHYGISILKQKYNHPPSLIKSPPTPHKAHEFLWLLLLKQNRNKTKNYRIPLGTLLLLNVYK